MSTPLIIFTQYSPYMVVDLQEFINSKGEALSISPVMSLCRCGNSTQKPYCDGSHSAFGIKGTKKEERTPDQFKDFTGKSIIIRDNRGICCHDGSCIRNLPSVFKRKERPWIDPDGASAEEIIRTIQLCPSGALSYCLAGKTTDNFGQTPSIRVSHNGPLEIRGGIKLKDDLGNNPGSKEHYCLCRCGSSKNVPFCDGSHSKINFEDPKN